MFKIIVLVALFTVVYSTEFYPIHGQAAGIPKALVTPIEATVNVVNDVLEVLEGAESRHHYDDDDHHHQGYHHHSGHHDHHDHHGHDDHHDHHDHDDHGHHDHDDDD